MKPELLATCPYAALPQRPNPIAATAPGNPCDIHGIDEICACCQGALDLDELLGIAPVFRREEASHAGSHHAHGMSLPLRLGATAWLAVPGICFGIQNFRQASRNRDVLREGLAHLLRQRSEAFSQRMQRTDGAGPLDTIRVEGQRYHEYLRNLSAYRATMQHSESLQWFVQWFAGALPAASASAVLIGVVCQPFEKLGTCLLGLYCGAHAVRYMHVERRRLNPATYAAERALSGAPLPAEGTEARIDLDKALQGAALVAASARARRRLFLQASVGFASYGLGALGLLLLSQSATALTLVTVGATFGLGLISVTVLNNFYVKDVYGKNRDAGLERLSLGSLADVYRNIQNREENLATLKAMPALFAKRPMPIPTQIGLYAWRTAEGLASVACYAVSFGLAIPYIRPLRDARIRREVHALAASMDSLPVDDSWLSLADQAEACATCPPHDHAHEHGHATDHEHGHAHDESQHTHFFSDKKIERRLYALLYTLPDKFRYERGALIDHAHARLLVNRETSTIY